MPANRTLRGLLERYRAGEIPLDEAAQEIEGLRLEAVGELALIDLGRELRCGLPEAVLAEGKTASQLAAIVAAQATSAGRCLVTRVSDEQAAAVREAAADAGLEVEERLAAGILIVSNGRERPVGAGVVGIVTAGTSDIPVAEEARAVAEEMGCTVRCAYDVGAAGIHRLFPALRELLDCHVFVVAAGREGTLPAVVAGLVDRPVIGVPVSTGYGFMGAGEAALGSMLQSCSVIAVVNIDAGFVAGAFAAKVARQAADI
ncbi:MAG: nickel pincer cofactor biosynthesis protein LarB [Methanospirillum sp.]